MGGSRPSTCQRGPGGNVKANGVRATEAGSGRRDQVSMPRTTAGEWRKNCSTSCS